VGLRRERAATGGSLHTPVHTTRTGAGGASVRFTIAIVRPPRRQGPDQSYSIGHQNAEALHPLAMNGTVPGCSTRRLQAEWSFTTTLNSMTFLIRKGQILSLTPRVSNRRYDPQSHRRARSRLSPGSERREDCHKYAGPCTASGFVLVVLLRTDSGQKLWSKRSMFRQRCRLYGRSRPKVTITLVAERRGARLGRSVYSGGMKKAWDYLSPEEMTLMKSSRKELRTKKVIQSGEDGPLALSHSHRVLPTSAHPHAADVGHVIAQSYPRRRRVSDPQHRPGIPTPGLMGSRFRIAGPRRPVPRLVSTAGGSGRSERPTLSELRAAPRPHPRHALRFGAAVR